MIKRLVSSLALAAFVCVLCGGVTGCEDDVKKTEKIETTKQSEPEMVSPGEPIVE